MAAHRCSDCGLDYPVAIAACEICGRRLDWDGTVTAASDWREQVALVRAASRLRENEEQRIVSWRLQQLLAAGYDLEAAEPLAARYQGADQIDLHQAVDLIAHGCTPLIAAAILL